MSQSKDFPDTFYRVTVKGAYVQGGKLLLQYDKTFEHTNEARSLWELPGGGLDFGEIFHDALHREIHEESGLEVLKISEKPVYLWTIKRVGKRNMDWHYALILVYRVELKNLDFTKSEECQEVRFFSKEELQSLDIGDQMEPLRTLFNPGDFQ